MEWSFTADYGSIHADFCSNMLYLNDYKNERINEKFPLSDFKRNDLFINEQKEYFDLIKGGENFQTLPDLTESKEILNSLLLIFLYIIPSEEPPLNGVHISLFSFASLSSEVIN